MIEQDILKWGIMLSTGQKQLILDVLDGIAHVEVVVKQELGYGVDEPPKGEPLGIDLLAYGLDDSLKCDQPLGMDMLAYGFDNSLKCDQQTVLCMRRRMLLARMTIVDEERPIPSEPLEALFGLNTEDTSAYLMDFETPERLLDIEDEGLVSDEGPPELDTDDVFISFMTL